MGEADQRIDCTAHRGDHAAQREPSPASARAHLQHGLERVVVSAVAELDGIAPGRYHILGGDREAGLAAVVGKARVADSLAARPSYVHRVHERSAHVEALASVGAREGRRRHIAGENHLRRAAGARVDLECEGIQDRVRVCVPTTNEA